MSARFVLALVLAGPVAVFAADTVKLNEFVAVSSTAAPGYRAGLSDAELKPETYVFGPGNFVPSGTYDRGLEKLGYEQLLRQLAPDLAKQKYFPTRDVAGADLLIMVHWGASQIYEDPQRDQAMDALKSALPAYQAAVQETGMADPGEMNAISDTLAWGRDNSQMAMARNAALLGYARSLHRWGADNGYQSERAKMLRSELAEERYFVVLMAYDNHLLRREKKKKLLWVTRLSVRTPGNNFGEALPVLSQAGSHVFGRQTEDLVHVKANLREGRVDIGELKVVGTDVAAPKP